MWPEEGAQRCWLLSIENPEKLRGDRIYNQSLFIIKLQALDFKSKEIFIEFEWPQLSKESRSHPCVVALSNLQPCRVSAYAVPSA